MISLKSAAVALLVTSLTTASEQSEHQRAKDNETCQASPTNYNVPRDCSVVMAPSDDNRYGMFSLQPRKRGSPVMFGDVVIQLPEVFNSQGLQLFQESWWSSEETGGMAEGKKVHSIVPGVAMLASPGGSKSANVLPYRPSKDDADCARESCKESGSYSYYHNYTFFVRKDMDAGEEFIVRYPEEWLTEHDIEDDDGREERPVEWLRQHGICLDNIVPRKSSISTRGAFSTRFIPKNSAVAPVPVLPIFDWTTSLKLIKKVGKGLKQQWQLLMNYCLGHPQSSMLLFPYSPIVNLVNHDRENPNVKLQWSQHPSLSHHNNDWRIMDLIDLEEEWDEKQPGLLLELVALRDIQEDEEIVLDYGKDWQAAWEAHSMGPHEGMYTPAYVMDEVASNVRTQTEQVEYPYAKNLETSCFYEYQNSTISTLTSSSGSGVTTIPWNWTRRVFDWKNLRPCSILQRDDATMMYTVKIRNRAGSSANPVPSKRLHIVSKVPRQAIRFTDKVYTTDQHLPDAFRRFIGIPDDIFPSKWRDELDSDDDH